MKNLLNSDQWNMLDAVKNNRILFVDTSLGLNNCGIFGKPIILQNLYQFFKEQH